MICKLASQPEEARIVLSAFAAVRASLVRRGSFKPFGERLAVAFVHVSEREGMANTHSPQCAPCVVRRFKVVYDLVKTLCHPLCSRGTEKH